MGEKKRVREREREREREIEIKKRGGEIEKKNGYDKCTLNLKIKI